MNVGALRQWVTLERRFTDSAEPIYTPLAPSGDWAAIEPGTPGDNGRTLGHFVTMRYRSDVNMDTRITYVDPRNVTHRMHVNGFQDVGLRGVELRLVCEEVVG